MAEPYQLPLFPDHARLTRIRPDLFGRALLARYWGRIGTKGHLRLDPYPDPGAALNALAALARRKRRRGYRETSA